MSMISGYTHNLRSGVARLIRQIAPPQYSCLTLACRSLASKNSVKLPDDFPKIPKLSNPYALFMKRNYEQIKSDTGSNSIATISKRASTMWAEMPEGERQMYYDEFNKAAESLKVVMESLTREQHDILKEYKQAKREEKTAKKERQYKKSMMPKRSRNAYQFFITQKAQDGKMEGQSLSFGTETLQQWHQEYLNLPEHEKQIYRNMSSDDKERYKNEMIKFVEDLRERGETHLLSQSSIIKYSKLSASAASGEE